MKKNKLIGKKVISKKFGEGIIKYVDNDGCENLNCAVEFKKYNVLLHSCNNHIKSGKGYWCTFNKKYLNKDVIIEFAETKAFTKKDLKVGDIITLRNGEKGEYEGKGTFIRGGLQYDNIENDLTNNGLLGNSLDIVKVERIKETEVVFERKEERTEILDEVEKAYLSSVIKPFRNKVEWIKKIRYDQDFISIKVSCQNCINLPYFKKDSMYKEMKVDKKYSLEELGL